MATQMGKTAGLLNVIGHKLDDDPAPVLYIGPTKSNIDGVIEPQVHQLLRESPSLWRKTLHGRKAQKLVKRVSGVTLRLAWAGSPTELASQPAHTVLVDEVDRMAPIPGEGDPVTLAEARTATYPDGRVVITSTPTNGTVETYRDEFGIEHWKSADPKDVESAVWKFWQEGTRFEWAVPCPHCDDYFVPRFKLLVWPKDCTPRQARKLARMVCPMCGGECEESHKVGMNVRGLFIAPGQHVVAGEVVGDPPDADTASFWVSGLMSPWRTFGACAAEWLTAVNSGDPESIRGKLNTVFGELYRIAADAPSWEAVRNLAAPYASGELPSGVLFITAAVDVQKSRLVYVVRGWGLRGESWLIENGELYGETERDEVWEDLADLLEKRWGGKAIRRMGIDSGYRPGDKWKRPTNMVYAFARQHQARAIATKGHDSLSKPLSPSMIDVTIRGQVFRKGLQLWHLDTDYFKSWVHQRLAWPADQPGAWHLPQDVTDDYCQQVTAEARLVKASGRVTWVRVRKDNHYLDCEAINVAVAHSLGVHRMREKSEPAPVAPEPEKATFPPQRQARRPQQRRGWMNSWRK